MLTYVYFALDLETGYVKIGCTRDVKDRIIAIKSKLQHNMKLLLAFPGSRIDEKALHRKFVSDCVIGEWFYYSNEIKTYIMTKLS